MCVCVCVCVYIYIYINGVREIWKFNVGQIRMRVKSNIFLSWNKNSDEVVIYKALSFNVAQGRMNETLTHRAGWLVKLANHYITRGPQDSDEVSRSDNS